jgi:hypothetical protein
LLGLLARLLAGDDDDDDDDAAAERIRCGGGGFGFVAAAMERRKAEPRSVFSMYSANPPTTPVQRVFYWFVRFLVSLAS